MNERQFELLMTKLEEIRCCIIDVEEEVKKSSQQANLVNGKRVCSHCGRVDERVICQGCGHSLIC